MADTTQSFSQLLLTYGPGAMLDLPNHAVVVSGLQGWNYSGGHKQIEEERLVPLLRQQLSLGPEFTGLRAPPELDEERHDDARPAVDVAVFPQWFTVEDVGASAAAGAAPGETWRRMVEFSQLSITNGDRMRFSDDAGKKHDVNPIRFVGACPKGHLEDIDWRRLVHRSGDHTCKKSMFWVERGVSSDPSDISVRCNCGARVTMADLYKPKFLGTCRAFSPWLRPRWEQGDACVEDLRLLPRSATNTYFSQTITIISLTASSDRLRQVIAQHRSFIDDFIDDPTLVSILRRNRQTKDDFAKFTDSEIERAISSSALDSEATSSQNPRVAEFDTLASGAETIGHDGSQSVLFAETLARSDLKGDLQSIVKAVVKVNRLREVTCLYGFTRLEPPPSAAESELDELQLNVDGAPLARSTQWLPAIEQFGEGIFVHIDEAELQAWLNKPAVQDAARQMYLAETVDAARFGRQERHLGAAYWAIHSLSHALMAEVAMECGYPLSSIKERIYASGSGQPGRFGLLIYTSTAGAQGTLGGLSETAYRLPRILDRALLRVELCSNDPVCSEHTVGNPLDERPLHGAACHACLLVPETSCESRNSRLDRTLIAKTLLRSDLTLV